jgi:hypothetical protein
LPRAENKAAATYIQEREKIHVKATRIKRNAADSIDHDAPPQGLGGYYHLEKPG